MAEPHNLATPPEARQKARLTMSSGNGGVAVARFAGLPMTRAATDHEGLHCWQEKDVYMHLAT